MRWGVGWRFRRCMISHDCMQDPTIAVENGSQPKALQNQET
jgi:hypothetical protein